jgi:hypothetical protein
MGRARVGYFDPSGGRAADLDGVAVAAWGGSVIQAHGRADTLAAGSEPLLGTREREHPLDSRAAARRTGLGAWLARDTGIPSLGQQSGTCR